ncbi:MAG: hypothetical protein E7482_00435 [Ruminococcaceae bacterium]|nr:hypothetical protein [Oscillospiraceae bacterium]
MALKLMPGETRNYSFKLPVAVSALSTVDVRFFQNEEKIVEYNEESENIGRISSDPFILIVTVPREDTLKFENRIRAYCQIEWETEGYHSVAKAQRITVGDYMNRDFVSGGV